MLSFILSTMHCILYSNVESSQALDNVGGVADDQTATTASEVESGKLTTLYIIYIYYSYIYY